MTNTHGSGINDPHNDDFRVDGDFPSGNYWSRWSNPDSPSTTGMGVPTGDLYWRTPSHSWEHIPYVLGLREQNFTLCDMLRQYKDLRGTLVLVRLRSEADLTQKRIKERQEKDKGNGVMSKENSRKKLFFRERVFKGRFQDEDFWIGLSMVK